MFCQMTLKRLCHRVFQKTSHRWPVQTSGGIVVACLAVTTVVAADPEAWSMFRGQPSNIGMSTAQLGDQLSLRWTYDTGEPIRSSAVMVGDRVWIGSDSGAVHALERDDGFPIWTFQTEAAVEAPPTVVDDLLVVGSGDGMLHALDSQSGESRWTYRTGDRITAAANWVRRGPSRRLCFVVGSYDGRVHCVDATSGEAIWVYDTDNYVNGAVAIAEGYVVFGGCDGLLHIVRADDGKAMHRIPLGSYVAATAAVRDGRAYVGHYDNVFLCADIRTGRIVWQYEDRPFAFFSSAAVTKELVVVGSRDKRVHAIGRRDGLMKWVFQTRGRVDSSPVVCGDRIVVGSDDGRLYLLNRKNGVLIWSYDIGEALAASPAVAEGWVVIGADDGRVYAFGPKVP